MAAPAVPQIAEWVAPATWRTVDFISDLHLQASEPATFDAWCAYMARPQADAVVILGDLFEVWVGDDAAVPGSFEAQCAQVMAATAARTPVYFMHGNRDFLVGDTFLVQCQTTLLQDPSVLTLNGERCLLTHGDALCLDDAPYMAFRAEVRSPGWQTHFLSQPLPARQTMARGLRDASEQRKRSGAPYADVDSAAVRAWLSAASAPQMLHGHTHRPADHALGGGLSRRVLSDWDAKATPPRLEVMQWSGGSWLRDTPH